MKEILSLPFYNFWQKVSIDLLCGRNLLAEQLSINSKDFKNWRFPGKIELYSQTVLIKNNFTEKFTTGNYVFENWEEVYLRKGLMTKFSFDQVLLAVAMLWISSWGVSDGIACDLMLPFFYRVKNAQKWKTIFRKSLKFQRKSEILFVHFSAFTYKIEICWKHLRMKSMSSRMP